MYLGFNKKTYLKRRAIIYTITAIKKTIIKDFVKPNKTPAIIKIIAEIKQISNLFCSIIIIQMSSLTYDINLNVIGEKNVTGLPSKIQKIGEITKSVTSNIEPINKIINLLERTNKILLEIGKVSVASFNRLDVVANNTAISFKKEENEADKLNKKIKEIGETAKNSNIKLSSLGNIGFDFNNIVGAVRNVTGLIAPVFKEGMAREVASTNFGTLFGDANLGKQYADTLRNTNMATLYGTNTINQNAQSMLAYGLDKDTTLDVLTAIGDIAMGDANKMSSLATAFSQMSSLGKLQSQDWKQMVGAGFNPFNQMQKDLGKTAEELDAMMSKGQISADMVKTAFINATKEGGQFAGALKNVMDNTLQGQISRLKSSFDDLKAKIYTLVLPIINKVIPVITNKLVPALFSIMDTISPIFALIADNIDTIGVFIGTLATMGTVIGVVNAIMAINPISLIIIGIATLTALIYKAIDAYNKWGAVILMIIGPIGIIVNLIMTIKRYWDDIITAFKSDGIIGGLKRIGVCILDVILYPLQQVLEWVGKLTDFEWAKNAQTAVNNFRDKLGAINPEEGTSEDKGILDTGLSSMSQLMQSVNAGLGSDNTLSNATKNSTEAVATGGTRNTQITINLDNMVENINFEGSVAENKESLTNQLQEILLRVLYSAQMAI